MIIASIIRIMKRLRALVPVSAAMAAALIATTPAAKAAETESRAPFQIDIPAIGTMKILASHILLAFIDGKSPAQVLNDEIVQTTAHRLVENARLQPQQVKLGLVDQAAGHQGDVEVRASSLTDDECMRMGSLFIIGSNVDPNHSRAVVNGQDVVESGILIRLCSQEKSGRRSTAALVFFQARPTRQ